MADMISVDMTSGVGGAIRTFASEADRKRLSATALKGFRRVSEQWHLDNVEAATLLGVSASTWDRVKAGKWDKVLSQDQMTRVSIVVGVFKGLHLLFADSMSDRWPKLPNQGPVFERLSPVAAMIEGGIPRMLETRHYVDALRGGL